MIICFRSWRLRDPETGGGEGEEGETGEGGAGGQDQGGAEEAGRAGAGEHRVYRCTVTKAVLCAGQEAGQDNQLGHSRRAYRGQGQEPQGDSGQ